MYKIMTLVRKGSSQTLWEFVTVVSSHMVDDPTKLPNKTTGAIPKIQVTSVEEYQTANITELEVKLKEILLTTARNNIRVVQDVTYDIDILF